VSMNMASGYPAIVDAAGAAATEPLMRAAGLFDDYAVITAGAATATRPLIAAGSIGIVPNNINNTATAVNCFLTYTPALAANTIPTVTVAATATADNCR